MSTSQQENPVQDERQQEQPDAQQQAAQEKAPATEEKVNKKAKGKKKAEKGEELAEMEKQLEQAQAQTAELNDRLLRSVAEFDNYRKRTVKEKESAFNDAKAKTLESMVAVLDNFERALEAECSDDSFKKGVALIFKQLQESLSALGVEEIEATGVTLDPKFHCAVMHIEDADKGAGEIVQVLQKGYRIGDRVIRCSMVQVAN